MFKITFIKESSLFSGVPLLSIFSRTSITLSQVDTLEGLKHKSFSNAGMKFFAVLEKLFIAPPKKYHKTFEELDISSFNASLDNFKKSNSVNFPYCGNKLYTSTPSGKTDFSAYTFARKLKEVPLDKITIDKDLAFYIDMDPLTQKLKCIPSLQHLYINLSDPNLPVTTLDSLINIDDN